VDLRTISKDALLAELKSRAETEGARNDNVVLVVGTICDYPEGPAVELFNKVESPGDLPSNNQMLRARFNGHHNYRMFHFKTDRFDELKSQLDSDRKKFSRWLVDCASVKMVQM